MLLLAQCAQGVEDFHISLFVDPVVAVHYFEILSGGVGQSGVDRPAVPGVGLVDGPDHIRISGGVGVSDLAGVIFCGTVVYNQNLHLIPACQQRIDASSHIIG